MYVGALGVEVHAFDGVVCESVEVQTAKPLIGVGVGCCRLLRRKSVCVGEWNVLQDVLCNGIECGCAKLDGLACCGAVRACGNGRGCIRALAEIAHALEGRGHDDGACIHVGRLVQYQLFIGSEEEELVPHDGTAKCATELVLLVGLAGPGGLKVGTGVQDVVAQIFIGVAVELRSSRNG